MKHDFPAAVPEIPVADMNAALDNSKDEVDEFRVFYDFSQDS